MNGTLAVERHGTEYNTDEDGGTEHEEEKELQLLQLAQVDFKRDGHILTLYYVCLSNLDKTHNQRAVSIPGDSARMSAALLCLCVVASLFLVPTGVLSAQSASLSQSQSPHSRSKSQSAQSNNAQSASQSTASSSASHSQSASPLATASKSLSASMSSMQSQSPAPAQSQSQSIGGGDNGGGGMATFLLLCRTCRVLSDRHYRHRFR